jgi:hypothetical protein
MEELPASVLAAFAHKACFDYVEHQTGGIVRAAVREELEKLEIVTRDEAAGQHWPGRNATLHVKVGTPVQLTVARPAVPDKRYCTWVVTECGPGRGELRPVTGDNASRLFVPTAAGRLMVKAECLWQGIVLAGWREIRIGLQSLPPCESIGSDGTMGVSEAAAAGTPDGFFHAALLVEHTDPAGRVDYGADPNHRRMQLSVEKALDRLLDLVQQEPGVYGALHIRRGYDPTAADLARVGRKLMLTHDSIALERLAALAHDAGFPWVFHPPYPEGIFVATGPEPPLEIVPGPLERLAPNAVVNWLGIMRPNAPEAPIMPGATFDATAPGNRHDDPSRVTYADELSHLMTPATQQRLQALLDRLQADGVEGLLHILGAFHGAATDRRRIGAALQMRHASLPLERLGALAHQAGFDYVKHVTVPSAPAMHHIYASVWRQASFSGLMTADLAEIVDYHLLNPGDYGEVVEGGVRQLCLRPDVLRWTPPPLAVPGGETETAGEEAHPPRRALFPDTAHYAWCLTRYGPGQGRLDSPPARAGKLFTAQRAGVVGARGEFVLGEGTEPYGFALAVVPDAHGHVPSIPKVVYDDLMNFLAFHHPVGVEGNTLALRPHVPDLMTVPQWQDANTERTYPHYRQRHGAAGPVAGSSSPISEVPCACPTWQGNRREEDNGNG